MVLVCGKIFVRDGLIFHVISSMILVMVISSMMLVMV